MKELNDFFFYSALLEECHRIDAAAEKAGYFYVWSVQYYGWHVDLISLLYRNENHNDAVERYVGDANERQMITDHLKKVWAVIEGGAE